MTTSFLLPCECAADVVVTAGQAGGIARCPRCGRDLAVPRLRDLGRLRRREPDSTAALPWRPAHAAALLGAVVAALALVARSWVGLLPGDGFDEAALRAAVMAADDREIARAWYGGLWRNRVRRLATEEEFRIQWRARFSSGLGRGLTAAAV
ncbi:MAG: hypothetical protein EBZ74_12360, partial [Planctomycetia bacterium]|nr:hypothetical protein [Planctomycetia bacterium]